MELNQVTDTWESGDSYERYVGRWSRQVAPQFLSWLGVPSGQRWLDLGCGTGALSAAILDHCSPSTVAGVEPSNGFIRTAKKNLSSRAGLVRGEAAHLPLRTSSVDAVVSGLVLNFVPDPGAALREMARVARDQGKVGLYVWDYAGKMEFMRIFWEAVAELNPQSASLDEGARFPVCNPDALKELFTHAGLMGIEVRAIDIPTEFKSFEAYWQPFLGGQGPGPAYVVALEPVERDRLRERLREHVPVLADGSISLIARAWAVRGTVDKKLFSPSPDLLL